MNRLLIFSALLACAGAVSAQSADMADEPEEASSSRSAASAKTKSSDRICIEQTGSRITRARNARTRDAEHECVAAGSRVYTRGDIENSGETDLADALRKLDPSIR
jgi:hypothetical protein